MPALRLAHESDAASRDREMLKSVQFDIPHVAVRMAVIGFVRQPPLARCCENSRRTERATSMTQNARPGVSLWGVPERRLREA